MTDLDTGVAAAALNDSQKKKWKAYIPTLVTCGAVLLVAGWPYQGFFVATPFLILLVWVPWNLVHALYKPERFVPMAIKLALWIATFSIILVLNRIYEAHALDTADRYAHTIEQYKKAHRIYPRNLEAAGLSDPGSRILHYYYDPADANGPMLMYRDTFDPFDRSYYDFERHAWKFHPD
jgi:hypothetical protein